jgi:hypothetical protein
LTIDAPPLERMTGMMFRMPRKVPVWFGAMMRCQRLVDLEHRRRGRRRGLHGEQERRPADEQERLALVRRCAELVIDGGYTVP